MSLLTSLANAAGTDKGTQSGACHGYSLIYEMMLAALRNRPQVKLLEMGLAIGGPELGGNIDREVPRSPSVDSWLSYYHDVSLVGFDISDFAHLEQENFTFVRGDSGRREDLERLLDLGPYDVIIDDASHASYHQQLALAVLFRSLKPGGLYFVEDLSWQPSSIEAEMPPVPRTAAVLSNLLASGRCLETAAISRADANSIDDRLSSVMMFDESLLNALGDGYNRRLNLPPANRAGWRGRSRAARLCDPRFWLYSGRRFAQGLTLGAGENWQSAKLAVLQARTDL